MPPPIVSSLAPRERRRLRKLSRPAGIRGMAPVWMQSSSDLAPLTSTSPHRPGLRGQALRKRAIWSVRAKSSLSRGISSPRGAGAVTALRCGWRGRCFCCARNDIEEARLLSFFDGATLIARGIWFEDKAMLRKLCLIAALAAGLASPAAAAGSGGFGRGAGFWHFHGGGPTGGGAWHWHGRGYRGYPNYGYPAYWGGYDDSSCWGWDAYSNQWVWICAE